ncbi:MAG: class I SAM-dependent methyltransferase [Planctomycetota bacterium]
MDSESLQFQTEAKRKWLGRNYDRAAWFYEYSAKVYSLNQITASKKYQLNHIQPGDSTIFLGVGSGEDALMAAEHGADVTCVDISSGMLSAVERKLKRKGLTANLICQSAFELDHFEKYDVCCANFFLNVFKEPDMIKMLKHASRLVKPGGCLMIADVALPQGNWLEKSFNQFYRKFAMTSFWMLGLVPLHRDYDYCSYFADAMLKHEHSEYFRLGVMGPVVYQCIVGRKLG